MRKLSLLLLSVFLSIACVAQDYLQISPDEWTFVKDSSAFDGETKSAIVLGTSNSSYVNTPVLAVNKTGTENNIYLTYYPVPLSTSNSLYVAFTGDKTIYKLSTEYSFMLKRYTVIFNDRLTHEQFINKIKVSKILYTRLIIGQYQMLEVIYTCNGAGESLEKLK